MARLGRSFPIQARIGTAVAVAPVTGTVAESLDNLTSAATGASGAAGTLAVTLGAVTSAATGTSAQTGTLAVTLANATSVAAGSTVSGTVTETLDNHTSAGSGASGAAGTVAVTLAATTSVAAGTSGQTGTLAENLDNISTTTSGASGAAGSLAETLDNTTSAASGTHTAAGISGDLAETLDNTTSVAAGTSAQTGTLAETLDNTTSVAAGSSVTGTLAETFDNTTSSASGAFADAVVGTVAATLGNLTSVASGTFTQSGPTIVNAQATGVGAPVAGTTGVTVTKPTGLADGDVMYAFVSRTDFSNTAAWTCSGWTALGPAAASAGSTTGNDVQTTILRKVVTNAAGEPSTYTFTCAFGNLLQSIGIIVALRGVDTTTPEDITVPAYGFTQNTINPATLNATSATDNAFVIAYMQQSLASAASGAMAAPSGYTLVPGGNTFAIAGGTLDNKAGTAYKLLGAAGATTGTNVWTNATDPGTAEALTAVVLVRAGVAGAVTGSLAETLDNTTSAAAGTFTPAEVTGTLTVTLAAVTSAAAGTSAQTGTLVVALAAVTSAASGTFTPGATTGTLAETLDNATSVAAGSTATGTLAATLGTVTSAASGTFEAPPTGTVDETLADLTATASGTVTGAIIGPDPSPLKCNIRHYRFTRPLRYRRAAERPAIDAWARSYSNELIDFSDPTYRFTFRVGAVGDPPVLEKATNILGATGSGIPEDGAPNLSIRWEPGELDLEPGIYECQLIARSVDLDTVIHGTLKILAIH